MKITHSDYEKKIHSISGYVWDTFDYESNLTSTFI